MRKGMLAVAVGVVPWLCGGMLPFASTLAAATDPCSLLGQAEVRAIPGRRLYDATEPMALDGGAACTYGSGIAQLLLFIGDGSAARLDALIGRFGAGSSARQPVAALGSGAYVVYPEPRDQYEDTIGLLVLPVGEDTIGVTLAAEAGQPADSVLPGLVAIAEAAAAKLR